MLSTRSNYFGFVADTLSQPLSFALLQRTLLSKSVLTIIDQIIYSASNFLTAVIVARSCSAQQFGLYILGLRLVDYCRETQNVLIWSPYMFLSPRVQGEAHKQYTGSTLAHQLGFSIIVALLFITASFFLTTQMASLMIPLAFLGVVFPLQEYTRRICFANFQTLAVVLLDTTVTVLQVIGLWWCAQQNRMSVSNAYWIVSAANALAVLGWLVWARRDYSFAVKEILPDFKKNWAQGKWLLGGNLTLLASTQIYPWSLTTFHGAAATGLYAAGEGVVNFARAFMISIQNFLGPKLAHAYASGGKNSLRRVVYQTTLLLGVITGGFSLLFALCGGQLATLIYGAKFTGLRWIVALLALNIFAWAITTSQSYAISTIERSEINFKINVLGMILSLSLGLGMVLQFGTIGAAGGLLLSNLITALIRQIAFMKIFRKEASAHESND